MDGWTILIFGGRSSTMLSPVFSASDWLVSKEDDFWFDDVSFPDSERNEPEVEAPSSGIVEHLLITPFVPRYAATLGGEGRRDDRLQRFVSEMTHQLLVIREYDEPTLETTLEAIWLGTFELNFEADIDSFWIWNKFCMPAY